MPYAAIDLIPANQKVVTAKPQESVKQALEKMIENDYSQLPIVDGNNRVLGVITADSILRAINSHDTKPAKLTINHASEDIKPHRVDDDIFAVLSYLREKPIAIIVNRDDTIEGLVSQYDTTQYFRSQAEDMMLIEDIEQSVNDHISAAFTNDKGDLQTDRLQSVINEITNSPVLKSYKGFLRRYQNYSDQKFSVDEEIIAKAAEIQSAKLTLDRLTFDQKITLLLHDDNWSSYGFHFGMERGDLLTLLEAVRDVRNKLAHFRGEATKVETSHLTQCVNLMKRFPPILPEATEEKIPEPSEQEIQEQVAAVEADGGQDGDITDEEIEEDYESRYAPLTSYLKAQSKKSDKVRLTFSQIATIIGDSLPPSAFNHRAWWANDLNHTQANAWLDAGWRATYLNMSNETVTFARSEEQDQKYIAFYSNILRELRKRKFDMRDVNPVGAPWIYVATLPYDDSDQHASLRFHMASKKRFRVSLYIDTKNKDANKQIFDRLFAQQDAIEAELKMPLTWERMDNKQASRVAIYKEDCSILASDEELEELAVWAADTMVKFEKVIAPYAEDAIKAVMS
jgi:CBS domain-containing protein